MTIVQKLAHQTNDFDGSWRHEEGNSSHIQDTWSQHYGYQNQYQQQTYGGEPSYSGDHHLKTYENPPRPHSAEYPGQQHSSIPRPQSTGYLGPEYSHTPSPQPTAYPSQYQQRAPEYSEQPGNPPLPKGWMAVWDPRYQRWYFADKYTGRAQWEVPRSGERRWDGPYQSVYRDPRGYGSSSGNNGAYQSAHHNAQVYQAYNPSGYQRHSGSYAPRGYDDRGVYAAGGLAAGGVVGGAGVAHILDDDSSSNYEDDNDFDDDDESPVDAPAPVGRTEDDHGLAKLGDSLQELADALGAFCA